MRFCICDATQTPGGSKGFNGGLAGGAGRQVEGPRESFALAYFPGDRRDRDLAESQTDTERKALYETFSRYYRWKRCDYLFCHVGRIDSGNRFVFGGGIHHPRAG